MAGGKVQAMTVLDILLTPRIVADAWDYFRTVQTTDVTSTSLFAPTVTPPLWLNLEIMAWYRPAMRPFCYDPDTYATYLEPLGITDPSLRESVQ